VFRQLGGQDFLLAVVFGVVETDALEIADNDVARLLAILQSVQIIGGLDVRPAERFAARLVLGNHHAWPEAIDVTCPTVQLLDAVFKIVYAGTVHAEDAKKLVPEGLRFAALVAGILPVGGKVRRAVTNFIPGQGHWFKPSAKTG